MVHAQLHIIRDPFTLNPAHNFFFLNLFSSHLFIGGKIKYTIKYTVIS